MIESKLYIFSMVYFRPSPKSYVAASKQTSTNIRLLYHFVLKKVENC